MTQDAEDNSLKLMISVGINGTALQHFTTGLFQFCDHDYFRYGRPNIEERILALRYVANCLETEAKIAAASEIAPK